MKQDEITAQDQMVGANEGCVLGLCRCGRAPRRPRQRNCRFCNREANRKYRAALKRQTRRLKEMVERLRGAAT
jgi:hypothetical protein